MNEEKIKSVGIVGFGFAGQLHVEALKSLDLGVEIIVSDADQGKKVQAEGLGVELVDLPTFLNKRPDLVITAVPPSYNLLLLKSIRQFYRPKGILVEKPLATSPDEARKIVQLFSNTGTFGMFGATGHGFHPEFKAAKQIIEAGGLGEIHTFTENIHQGGPQFPPHYLTKNYGGVIQELGIHTIDHLHYLLGRNDWKVVSASGGYDHWQAETADWCEVTFVSKGIQAHTSLLFSRDFELDLNPDNYSTTIIGTKGKMIVYGFDSVKVMDKNGVREVKFHQPGTNTRDRHLPGFKAEVEAFIDAAVKGEDSPLDLSYGAHLQEVLEDIESVVLESIEK